MLTPLAISYANTDTLGPFLTVPRSSSPFSPSFALHIKRWRLRPLSPGNYNLGGKMGAMDMGLGLGFAKNRDGRDWTLPSSRTRVVVLALQRDETRFIGTPRRDSGLGIRLLTRWLTTGR